MRITIYTRNDCVQCHATKRAMENRGFDFEMINQVDEPYILIVPSYGGGGTAGAVPR